MNASAVTIGNRRRFIAVAGGRFSWLYVGWMLLSAVMAPAGKTVPVFGSEQNPKSGRWAIVPLTDEVRPLCDLLTAQLSRGDDLQLVERAEIDKVFKEQELSVAGLVRPQARLQLGKALGAEALVLVASPKLENAGDRGVNEQASPAPFTRIRLVDVGSGVRLLDLMVSSAANGAELESALNRLAQARKKMRQPAASRHFLGIMGFTSEDWGANSSFESATLNALVESDLSRLQDVVVVERSDLDQLQKESELSGIELDLRASTWLVQGGLTKDGNQMQLSLSISPLAGGQRRLFKTTSPSEDLATIRSAIVAAIAKELGERAPPAAPGDIDVEADQFSQQGEWLKGQTRFAEAAPMYAAAHALAPCQHFGYSAYECRVMGATPYSLEQGKAVLALTRFDLDCLRRRLVEHPDGDGFGLDRLGLFWYADGKDRDFLYEWRQHNNKRNGELPPNWTPMEVGPEARRLEADVHAVYREKTALLAASLRGQGISESPLTRKLPAPQPVAPFVPPKQAPLPKAPPPDDPWRRYTWQRITFVPGPAADHALWEVFVDHSARSIRGHDELVLFWHPLPVAGSVRTFLMTRLRKPGGPMELVGHYDIEGGMVGRFAVSPRSVFVLATETELREYSADQMHTYTLDKSIPRRQLTDMAWFDGRIYLSVDAMTEKLQVDGKWDEFGALVRFDPATGKSELVASSKSAVVRHGLDHCSPYGIYQLTPDPEHKCLWFTVRQQKGQLQGLWKYMPASGQCQQVLSGDVRLVPGASGLLVQQAVQEYEGDLVAWWQVDRGLNPPQRLSMHSKREQTTAEMYFKERPSTAINSYHTNEGAELVDPWDRHFSAPRHAPYFETKGYFEDGLVGVSGNQNNAKLWYIAPRSAAQLPTLAPATRTDAPNAAPAPKLETITNSIGMKFVLVPEGEFAMGSPATESRHTKNEQQHRVRITHPFYLGVHPVTQAEYQRVMTKNPSLFSPTGEGREQVAGLDASRLPVESISWSDAQEFCKRLSQMEGQTYRLPTEAEWEYACRAGTTTAFNVGDTLSQEYANVEFNIGHTTPAGSYPPNAFGLCDMHGNVSQWCSDWFNEQYYFHSPAENPTGPATGTVRVFRGGGWPHEAVYCRAAQRWGGINGYVFTGLRVARDK
ncbi:MAG: SUMF1/EgtB/PvdO family nonheme iron enzyme [Planctomycetes bacterium]|nr:SUMF1/EgtB/PvdO family nonheme iron enzyme [Planctomycetota bacterium]